jgi:hypothetical protein
MYYGWLARLLFRAASREIKNHQERVEQQFVDEIEIVDRFQRALETIGTHTETRNFAELAGIAAARLLLLTNQNNSILISSERASAFLSILLGVFTDLLQADRNEALRIALREVTDHSNNFSLNSDVGSTNSITGKDMQNEILNWLGTPNAQSLDLLLQKVCV